MKRRGRVKTFSTEELRDKLTSFLKELRNECVIVEGIKDKKALESFGFSNVHVLNKGLYEFSTKFRGKVLILTDFDPEGENISKKLTSLLLKVGCKVEINERRKLRSLFIKNKLTAIEGLNRFRSNK